MKILKTKREKLQEKFNKDLAYLRKSIPARYNKVLTLDFLTDDQVDMLMSITTRGDGKSYQYFYILLVLAIKYDDFKLLVIARHYTLRNSYMALFEQIFIDHEEGKKIFFQRTDFYIKVYYDKKIIALITDLGAATDLKYESSVLQHFRMIVYDEFLAIDGDYLPDEVERLKTIYESVDRGKGSDIIGQNPKLLLIGNPVNFNSPLLAYWGMFDILEKQPMNSVRKYGNKVIERFRNEDVNKDKNNRLFDQSDNSSVTGEFKVNKTLIVDDAAKHTMPKHFNIRLDDGYTLRVNYADGQDYYLAIDAVPTDDYQFVMNIADYKPGTRILEDDDYDALNRDEYIKHRVLFADTFTITYLDRREQLQMLDIKHLIAQQEFSNQSIQDVRKDLDTERYEDNRIRQIKRRLFREYFYN